MIMADHPRMCATIDWFCISTHFRKKENFFWYAVVSTTLDPKDCDAEAKANQLIFVEFSWMIQLQAGRLQAIIEFQWSGPCRRTSNTSGFKLEKAHLNFQLETFLLFTTNFPCLVSVLMIPKSLWLPYQWIAMHRYLRFAWNASNWLSFSDETTRDKFSLHWIQCY